MGRMRHSAFFVVAVAMGFAFASCNDDSATQNPSATSTDAQWMNELAAVLCNLNDQCCPKYGLTPLADCLNQTKAELNRQLDREVDAGARLDRQVADRCMAAYRSLAPSCPAKSDHGDACEGFYARPPSPPATCDAACVPSDVGTPTCYTSSSVRLDGAVTQEQLCQVVITVAPGGACDSYGRKPIERHCDLSLGSSCVQGVCSTPKPIGAPCTTTDTTECVREAYCSGGVCTARIPVGGACSAQDCVSGSYCDTGTCRAITIWGKFCKGDFD